LGRVCGWFVLVGSLEPNIVRFLGVLSMYCRWCGDDVAVGRSLLGFSTCLECGEREAREVRHCIVPMNKSNYVVVSDVSLLKQLNPKRSVA
jgi:hypothetical protein